MPQTKVNTPFGPVNVDHPEGATQEQILRFAKRHHEARVAKRAEIEASYEPATGLSDSSLRNFAAGAGKFLADRARGVSQIFGADNQAEIDEAKRLDAPLMSSKAGLAGNILGGAAFTAPIALVPGAGTSLGAASIGGALGVTEPVGSGGSRLANTALGAGGGYIGNKIGNALTNRAGSALNSAQERVLNSAERLGFKTTAGIKTGSKALQRAEAALESKPFTSGPIDALKAENQALANKIVAESIGEVSDVVDDRTLNSAFSRIGGVFEDIAENTPARTIGSNEGVRAGQFLSQLQDEFSGITSKPVLNDPLIERFTNLVAAGQATGRQLQSLTSKLGKKAHTQLTSGAGDRDLGRALLMTKEQVDDLIEGGLSGEQLSKFSTAREQWRNLARITSRVGNINPSSGNVNLNSIASTLQKGDKFGFLRGNDNSPLNVAAKFGQAFRPIVGDSGTATRQGLGPTDVVLGAPFNVGSRAFFSDPVQGLLSGSSTAAGRIGEALGPAADPRLLGLLGASAATSQ